MTSEFSHLTHFFSVAPFLSYLFLSLRLFTSQQWCEHSFSETLIGIMISHFFSLSLERQRGGKGWEREKESQERVNREFLLSFFPAFSCSLFLWMVSSEFHDTKERNVVFLNPFIFNHQGFAASFQNECAYGSHTVCNSVVVADWSCCFISLSLCVCVSVCVCVCVCVCVNRAAVVVFLSRDSKRCRILENVPLPRWDAPTSLPKFIRSLYLSSIPRSCKWKGLPAENFPADHRAAPKPASPLSPETCQSSPQLSIFPPGRKCSWDRRLRGCF